MRHVNLAFCVSALSVVIAGLAHAAPTCKAPRMMIVLDKSSSMITGMVGTKTKWEVAKVALSTILNTYQKSIDFGLVVFPNPDQCGPGSVKVPIGANNASAILAALASAPPASGNYTPMAQTLDAVAQLKELQDAAYENSVLLITDGWQWCSPYDPATRFLPASSAQNLAALNIPTYVVGFGESVDPLTLNKMAAAGKTKVSSSCDVNGNDYQAANNCYYQANDTTQLATALQKIAKIVTAEKCDGLDNDCNGLVDDNLTRACSSACGTGSESCTNGSWGGCSAPQPLPEICDGKDNNCDGTIDEGCACKEGETRACGQTKGECTVGTQSCKGGTWSACGGEVTPTAEICDGKDNNCDGMIDENLTRPCQTACGAGSEACAGGSWTGCTAPQPTKEICDGLDNDCDGVVDGPNAICENGGVCVKGTCQKKVPNGASGGCDCRLGGATTTSLPALFLLALGVLLLGARRRRPLHTD